MLSDILMRLSVKGTLYFRTSFTPPFGVAVPDYENVARFHYAHRGDCMVHVPVVDRTVRLAQGDLIIVPFGARHNLLSHNVSPDSALPLEWVLKESGYKGEGVLIHGGEDSTRETQLICGHFSFAAGSRHLIFDRLPAYIVIPNYGEAAGAWLEATLRVIGAEAGGAQIGGDLIALKMSEAIFAMAIRAYIESEEAASSALTGFADVRLARALTEFHQDPAQAWTVEDLARAAGMSRTAFAQVFNDKLGLTPMQYVTSWRMQIARQALAEQKVSVTEAAELAGYASEAAFSRVFKREIGLPPGTYRTAQ